MLYCHIIDNEIQTTARPLPEDITEDTALSNGWYPAVFLNMPHHIESQCNVVTQYIKMNMEFDGSVVKLSHVIENKSLDEVEITRTLLMSNVRNERDNKLLKSDWTQLTNAQLTPEKKIEWETYRQELRDFPNTVQLNNIVWPIPPQY